MAKLSLLVTWHSVPQLTHRLKIGGCRQTPLQFRLSTRVQVKCHGYDNLDFEYSHFCPNHKHQHQHAGNAIQYTFLHLTPRKNDKRFPCSGHNLSPPHDTGGVAEAGWDVWGGVVFLRGGLKRGDKFLLYLCTPLRSMYGRISTQFRLLRDSSRRLVVPERSLPDSLSPQFCGESCYLGLVRHARGTTVTKGSLELGTRYLCKHHTTS